ncbi:unnamed protein product [Peronospora belbahrii]|uniref:Uncharacterized protein n=1 Tax=Peronospora belbahrii TaxID=622444 RepID=A0AAU9L9M5_9STRA|nr:unnamed protein product [Peronospora belbahrii]
MPTTPACTETLSSDAVDAGANSNYRTADVIKYADNDNAKRQKPNTESRLRFHTVAFSPTKNMFFQEATMSSASAPVTLYISPVAPSACLLFPYKRKQMTWKQTSLADMPPLLMGELERDALQYLDKMMDRNQQQHGFQVMLMRYLCTKFRPAFYRPTVMLGHSGLRRPKDAISRLLICQDKRNIQCFVQILEIGAKVSRCTHVSKKTTSALPSFVLLDLLSLRSFHDLYSPWCAGDS